MLRKAGRSSEGGICVRGNIGRNIGAISADAVAGTVGNLVVSNVQAASVGKTDMTAQRMQEAIDGVNGQILPGGLGGVGSGFVPAETLYSSNAALFGMYGGLVDNSQAPYSGAAALFGPSSGLAASQIDSHPVGLVDNSGSSENLLYAWDRARQYGADGWNATKQFAHDMVGATSMDAARANWNAGNYGMAVAKGSQSVLEAGLTVFTLGAAAPIKTGINALVNGGRALLASEVIGGGAPIFSSGGLLGSRMWASSVGTGAIGASITAGLQYFQNGTINPVDVAVGFGTGFLGSYGKLAWNVGVNAAGGVAGTAINNVVYGKNDNILAAGVNGGLLSGVGYGIGKLGESWINTAMKPTINTPTWATTGTWSASGWNLLAPNTTPVIGGSVVGGLGQGVIGPIVPSFPYGSGQK